MHSPNIGTQHVPRESCLRVYLRWMLPACGALDRCLCRYEDERPCSICLDYLKRCYIDMARILDLDVLCAHGLVACLDCVPKKRRKR